MQSTKRKGGVAIALARAGIYDWVLTPLFFKPVKINVKPVNEH